MIMFKTKNYHQNSGIRKSHSLSFSIVFFSGSMLLAILLWHNQAYAAQEDKYGPTATKCLTEPDHYVYAYHTTCDGYGYICVPDSCPPPPNPY